VLFIPGLQVLCQQICFILVKCDPPVQNQSEVAKIQNIQKNKKFEKIFYTTRYVIVRYTARFIKNNRPESLLALPTVWFVFP